MKNKNNPKSKKYGRQSRALARLKSRINPPHKYAIDENAYWYRHSKSQIAILEAKGVK